MFRLAVTGCKVDKDVLIGQCKVESVQLRFLFSRKELVSKTGTRPS